MTATIEETDLSTFTPPAIPCDYPRHDEVGDGPAVWVVRFATPMTCGCRAKTNPAFACDKCWRHRLNCPGLVCVHCGYITYDPMENVESVERI